MQNGHMIWQRTADAKNTRSPPRMVSFNVCNGMLFCSSGKVVFTSAQNHSLNIKKEQRKTRLKFVMIIRNVFIPRLALV